MKAVDSEEITELPKGSAFRDEKGTRYVIFDPIDDSQIYVYVANFDEKTVVKMRLQEAIKFVRAMDPIDVGFTDFKKSRFK